MGPSCSHRTLAQVVSPSASHCATSGVRLCPCAECCRRQRHGDVCALGAQSHPSCPLVMTRRPRTVPSWATSATVPHRPWLQQQDGGGGGRGGPPQLCHHLLPGQPGPLCQALWWVGVGQWMPVPHTVPHTMPAAGSGAGSRAVSPAGRSSQLSDTIVDKFERCARAVGLSEDVIYYFPTYGECHAAARSGGS